MRVGLPRDLCVLCGESAGLRRGSGQALKSRRWAMLRGLTAEGAESAEKCVLVYPAISAFSAVRSPAFDVAQART